MLWQWVTRFKFEVEPFLDFKIFKTKLKQLHIKDLFHGKFKQCGIISVSQDQLFTKVFSSGQQNIIVITLSICNQDLQILREKRWNDLGNRLDLSFACNIYGAHVNVIKTLQIKGYKYDFFQDSSVISLILIGILRKMSYSKRSFSNSHFCKKYRYY